MLDQTILQWLLEDNVPAVKYRTQRELLEESGDSTAAKNWIYNQLPANWQQGKGLWYRYYVVALAECGLTAQEVNLDDLNPAFVELKTTFDCSCADLMLLTALVKLGFEKHPAVQETLEQLSTHLLPDGGFLCLRRLSKHTAIPKSCYKANLHALLLLAACRKKDIVLDFETSLMNYFLKRGVFYQTKSPTTLVLDARPGWRTIDIFYPFEVMRVGLQNVTEAFAALGYGADSRLQEMWHVLNNCKDASGKVLLGGTLTKSYLPKERVGKPSKWATFYTLLAEKERAF